MSVDMSWGPHEDPEVLADELGADDLGLDDLGVGFEEPAHVDPSVVRGLLQGVVGGGLHMVAGDEDVPDHWRFTDRELDDLVPPLTRYINRQPKLRAAVMRGDQIVIGTVLAGYIGRNFADGRAAAHAREEQESARGHVRGEDQRSARPGPRPARQDRPAAGGGDGPADGPAAGGAVPATLALPGS